MTRRVAERISCRWFLDMWEPRFMRDRHATESRKRAGFLDGASHQRRDPYRQSPWDTGFFVLQTSRASRKWPVTQVRCRAGANARACVVSAWLRSAEVCRVRASARRWGMGAAGKVLCVRTGQTGAC